MKKFKALTYVELTIAMVILGLVMVFVLQAVRPKRNIGTDFFIATWDSLMKTNEELIYLNEQEGHEGLPTNYCFRLNDLISTRTEANCITGNFTLSSGVSVSNLSNALAENGTNIITLGVRVGKRDYSHAFTIYQHDGMIVPDIHDSVLNETLKFRVVTKEDGRIIEDTKYGVSFKDAVCYMRGESSQQPQGEGLEEQNAPSGPDYSYGITDCDDIERNTDMCPHLESCQIEIVMPNGKSFI